MAKVAIQKGKVKANMKTQMTKSDKSKEKESAKDKKKRMSGMEMKSLKKK